MEEASEDTGITKTILYQLVHRQDFPAMKVGRRWIIHKALLAEWIEDRAKERAQL